jgi:hypothetical protein
MAPTSAPGLPPAWLTHTPPTPCRAWLALVMGVFSFCFMFMVDTAPVRFTFFSVP